MFLISFAHFYRPYSKISCMEPVANFTAVRQVTDPKLKPSADFSKETYLFWYERMLLIRKFEEKASQLYSQTKNQRVLPLVQWAGSLYCRCSHRLGKGRQVHHCLP